MKFAVDFSMKKMANSFQGLGKHWLYSQVNLNSNSFVTWWSPKVVKQWKPWRISIEKNEHHSALKIS